MMYDHVLKENNESMENFRAIQQEYNEKIGEYINRNTQL
jgi:hypothetical protein